MELAAAGRICMCKRARQALEPAKIPANCALFVRDQETPFASDCVVGPAGLEVRRETGKE
jgi:hypothetical protein